MGECRPQCSDHFQQGWFNNNGVWVGTIPPINFPTCPPNDPALVDNCGLKWNWILELGGILIVAVGALRLGSFKGPASTRPSKNANHLTYIYRNR